MATKATKKADGTAASKRTTTRTSTGASVRRPAPTSRDVHHGAANSRPGETELDRLTREKEASLAAGETQPHPQNAPRMARTSTVQPPVGRAHQPRQTALEGEGKGTIRVRAKTLGYYNHIRRREGDTFTLVPLPNATYQEVVLDKDGEPKEDRYGRIITRTKVGPRTAEQQFSERWMERVDDDTPEKVTTGAEALKAHHDQLLAEKMGGRGTGSADVI